VDDLRDKVRVLERSAHDNRHRIQTLTSENADLDAGLQNARNQIYNLSMELEKSTKVHKWSSYF
jgi:predicted RNase H-like nuclease (RuvC/YqgF family)